MACSKIIHKDGIVKYKMPGSYFCHGVTKKFAKMHSTDATLQEIIASFL